MTKTKHAANPLYEVIDHQVGRYMCGTDEKPLTFKECVDTLVSFFSVDHTTRELKEIRRIFNSGNSYSEITIEEVSK